MSITKHNNVGINNNPLANLMTHNTQETIMRVH